ncbi:MAG TPA: transcription antitermination factor NusB [Clostridia bacterium]|nr:transcription antitermination factor NusB [Clostridia bacterium]
MRRTEARELLMQLLFQMEAQNDFSRQAKDSFAEFYLDNSSQVPYFNKIFDAFFDNRVAIDNKINETSSNWSTSRMAKVDLAVIRLCITEMLFVTEEDIPIAAAINEAVVIAKKFGGEESGKFVNGVLGKVALNNG